jgi:hypothetical protein
MTCKVFYSCASVAHSLPLCDCPPPAPLRAAACFPFCHPFSSGLSCWTDSLRSCHKKKKKPRRVIHCNFIFGGFFMVTKCTTNLASGLTETSNWSWGKPDEGWVDQVNLIPTTKTCVQLVADQYHLLQAQRRIYLYAHYICTVVIKVAGDRSRCSFNRMPLCIMPSCSDFVLDFMTYMLSFRLYNIT